MKKESKTNFINRVMGLSFKSTQGKYSFCNDERKQVLFSLNLSNGEENNVILSPNWSKNGYAHSIKHINKVLKDGYDLLIYKVRTKQVNGETRADKFEPLLEKRKLIEGGNGAYIAIPINDYLSKDVCESGKEFYEGAKKTITVNAYERNLDARKACIDALGCSCLICGFNFESTYGERGKGFIHVHHLIPLSDIQCDYKINPITDLIPVCPNCHAMLHRNGHTISPTDVTLHKS
jgi:5-methylcytosine-specific restriction protein A